MLTIPVHSLHILQPLDWITFSLFISKLQKLKHKYNFEKPIPEKRALLLQLVYWALYSAFWEDHILSAFACAGIYPTNRSLHHGSAYVINTIMKPMPERRMRPWRAQISGTLLTSEEVMRELFGEGESERLSKVQMRL